MQYYSDRRVVVRSAVAELLLTEPRTLDALDDLQGTNILVFYSTAGTPVKLEVFSDVANWPCGHEVRSEVRVLGNAVATFRALRVESPAVALDLRRLLLKLFGTVLPLSTPLGAGDPYDAVVVEQLPETVEQSSANGTDLDWRAEHPPQRPRKESIETTPWKPADAPEHADFVGSVGSRPRKTPVESNDWSESTAPPDRAEAAGIADSEHAEQGGPRRPTKPPLDVRGVRHDDVPLRREESEVWGRTSGETQLVGAPDILPPLDDAVDADAPATGKAEESATSEPVRRPFGMVYHTSSDAVRPQLPSNASRPPELLPPADGDRRETGDRHDTSGRNEVRDPHEHSDLREHSDNESEDATSTDRSSDAASPPAEVRPVESAGSDDDSIDSDAALSSDESQPFNPFAPPELTEDGLPMTKAQKREWRRKMMRRLAEG